MAHRIIIQCDVGAGVHRIRNLGEALFRSLPAISGALSLCEIDRATDRLEVAGVHSSKLKRCLDHIRQTLYAHRIGAVLQMEREGA